MFRYVTHAHTHARTHTPRIHTGTGYIGVKARKMSEKVVIYAMGKMEGKGEVRE